jgi:hypothetical protein
MRVRSGLAGVVAAVSVTAGATEERNWSRVWGSASNDHARAVAYDADTNLYVAGYTEDAFHGATNPGIKCATLTCWDRNGTRRWTRLWGPPGSYAEAYDVAVNRDGAIFVTGQTWGPMDGQNAVGNGDFFLSRFDAAGTRVWTRIWGSASSDGGRGIATFDGTNVFVAGSARGSVYGQPHVNRDDFCLSKFDADGNHVWTRMWGAVNALVGYEGANDVAVDPVGNVYVAGFSDASVDGQPFAGTFDIVLTCFTAAGVKNWTRMWGGTGIDKGCGVAVDAADRVYVVGSGGSFNEQMAVGSTDPFLMRVETNGTPAWTRLWGSTQGDYGWGVAADGSGGVFVVGQAPYGYTFDGQDGYGGGAYLTRFTADGVKQWTKRWGVANTEGRGVAAVDTNLVFVTGLTYGAFDCETMAGNDDQWVTRWGPFGPPRITSGPFVFSPAPGEISAQWDTSKPTDAALDCGRYAPRWECSASDATRAVSHSVTATGLARGATYRCRARSADAAGQSVTSAVAYVTVSGTNAASGVGHAFALMDGGARDFLANASGDVDRVEFLANGMVVGVRYGGGFRWTFAPGDGLMTLGTNQLAAVGYRADGMMAGLAAGSFVVGDTGLATYVEFEEPWRGAVVYTTSNAAPATNILLRVEAGKQVTVMVGDGVELPLGMEGAGFRLDWASVTNVEFRLERQVVHTSRAPVRGQELHHEYLCDVTGLSTGLHRVAAIVRPPPGYRTSMASASFRVEKQEARIEMGRDVTFSATSNALAVTLRVYNRGSAAAYLNRIEEEARGFQLCRIDTPWPGVSVGTSFDYAERTCRMTVATQAAAAVSIAAGAMVTLHYHAVPVLFDGGCDYQIGGAARFRGVDALGEPLDVAVPSVVTRVWVDPDYWAFDDAVSHAIGTADYLALTSPMALAGMFGRDANRVLEKAAELTTHRGGVLGYYHSMSAASSAFREGDLVAAGEMFDTWDDLDQIFVGDMREGRIRPFTRGHEMADEPMPIAMPLRAGDAMALGDVLPWDATGTTRHDRAEIVVAWGGNHGSDSGEVHVLKEKHHPETNAITDVVVTHLDFPAGGALATARTRPDGELAEVLIALPDGTLTFNWCWDDGSRREVRRFVSDYRSNDLVVAGDVLSDELDEIIVGSRADGSLIVYGRESWAAVGEPPDYREWTRLPVALSAGDGLAVGDVVGDGKKEIVFADASADRIVVYQWDSAAWGLTHVERIPWDFDSGDRLLCGRLGSRRKAQILVVRGSSRDGVTAGHVEMIRPASGETPGDRYALDALLNPGGEWAAQLRPDWTSEGHLLIVGESEIVPAFTDTWRVYLNARHENRTVDFTDRDYANTRDETDKPELSVGRIVGDSVDALLAPMNASLDIATGAVTLVNGSALGVAGNEDGQRFRYVRRSVCGTLEGKGFAVSQMNNDGGAAVFGAGRDRDVIFFSGHGSAWTWDGLGTEDLRTNFVAGTKHPLVYVGSCLTGRYSEGLSFAERFLLEGACGYVGAVETTVSCGNYGRGWGPRFVEAFTGRLQREYTIGQTLKHTKRYRLSDSANTYSWDWNLNRYHCAAYHLYGDPKLSFDWGGSDGVSPRLAAAPPEPPRLALAGPLTTLRLAIPMYQVDHTNGVDFISIPGQGELTEPEYPAVPLYTATVEFPSNCCVQGVELAERSGETAVAGLHPEIVAPVTDGGGVANQPTPGAGWWPTNAYAWRLEDHGATGSTLYITAYPFFHNTNTVSSLFYSNFVFDIAYAWSPLAIRRVALDRPVYTNGQTLTADVALRSSEMVPMDVVLQSELVAEADQSTTPLPVRLLRNLRGWAACRIQWELSGLSPGTHRLDVTARRATDDTVLDRESATFAAGAAELRMRDFGMIPGQFRIGETVDLAVTLDNHGAMAAAGQVIFLIQDGAGLVVWQSRCDFTGLAPGASQAIRTAWAASLNSRNCRVIVYAVYDGRTTGLQLGADGLGAPLCVDAIREESGRAVLRWRSVAGRRYAVERATDLTQGFTPLPGYHAATPPENEVRDENAPPGAAFYRIVETPATP